MKICILYSSPKLGDLFLHLPFIKAISENYKTKVSICVNQHINIKSILKEQSYIDEVYESYFRRGRYFFKDLLNLSNELKKKNFDKAFILEKTKGTAIACKLARISKIYGFGIGSQKYFVNNEVLLKKKDLRYNYTEQSKKFLNKLNINVNFNDKFLSLKNFENLSLLNEFKKFPKPWVCLAVDSTEKNRIWPMKNFSMVADQLYEKKLGNTFFVINSQNYENYFQNLINSSKNPNLFLDCKKYNRKEIINIISLCEYFVGIDSGPSCVAGALQKKTFCIIGATDATLPQYGSMIKIKSHIYNPSREIGIKRCGDNFASDNSEVKTIKAEHVTDVIINNLEVS